MNMIKATILSVILVLVSSPVLAKDMEYTGVDQALMGFNGVLTSPADPVMGLLMGNDMVAAPWFVAPVTDRVVGVVTGSLGAVHRVIFGTFDMLMSPFPVTHVSPDPRFRVVPGAPLTSKAPAGF